LSTKYENKFDISIRMKKKKKTLMGVIKKICNPGRELTELLNLGDYFVV
jgi:hypothetical protein